MIMVGGLFFVSAKEVFCGRMWREMASTMRIHREDIGVYNVYTCVGIGVSLAD